MSVGSSEISVQNSQTSVNPSTGALDGFSHAHQIPTSSLRIKKKQLVGSPGDAEVARRQDHDICEGSSTDSSEPVSIGEDDFTDRYRDSNSPHRKSDDVTESTYREVVIARSITKVSSRHASRSKPDVSSLVDVSRLPTHTAPVSPRKSNTDFHLMDYLRMSGAIQCSLDSEKQDSADSNKDVQKKHQPSNWEIQGFNRGRKKSSKFQTRRHLVKKTYKDINVATDNDSDFAGLAYIINKGVPNSAIPVTKTTTAGHNLANLPTTNIPQCRHFTSLPTATGNLNLTNLENITTASSHNFTNIANITTTSSCNFTNLANVTTTGDLNLTNPAIITTTAGRDFTKLANPPNKMNTHPSPNLAHASTTNRKYFANLAKRTEQDANRDNGAHEKLTTHRAMKRRMIVCVPLSRSNQKKVVPSVNNETAKIKCSHKSPIRSATTNEVGHVRSREKSVSPQINHNHKKRKFEKSTSPFETTQSKHVAPKVEKQGSDHQRLHSPQNRAQPSRLPLKITQSSSPTTRKRHSARSVEGARKLETAPEPAGTNAHSGKGRVGGVHDNQTSCPVTQHGDKVSQKVQREKPRVVNGEVGGRMANTASQDGPRQKTPRGMKEEGSGRMANTASQDGPRQKTPRGMKEEGSGRMADTASQDGPRQKTPRGMKGEGSGRMADTASQDGPRQKTPRGMKGEGGGGRVVSFDSKRLESTQPTKKRPAGGVGGQESPLTRSKHTSKGFSSPATSDVTEYNTRAKFDSILPERVCSKSHDVISVRRRRRQELRASGEVESQHNPEPKPPTRCPVYGRSRIGPEDTTSLCKAKDATPVQQRAKNKTPEDEGIVKGGFKRQSTYIGVFKEKMSNIKSRTALQRAMRTAPNESRCVKAGATAHIERPISPLEIEIQMSNQPLNQEVRQRERERMTLSSFLEEKESIGRDDGFGAGPVVSQDTKDVVMGADAQDTKLPNGLAPSCEHSDGLRTIPIDPAVSGQDQGAAAAGDGGIPKTTADGTKQFNEELGPSQHIIYMSKSIPKLQWELGQYRFIKRGNQEDPDNFGNSMAVNNESQEIAQGLDLADENLRKDSNSPLTRLVMRLPTDLVKPSVTPNSVHFMEFVSNSDKESARSHQRMTGEPCMQNSHEQRACCQKTTHRQNEEDQTAIGVEDPTTHNGLDSNPSVEADQQRVIRDECPAIKEPIASRFRSARKISSAVLAGARKKGFGKIKTAILSGLQDKIQMKKLTGLPPRPYKENQFAQTTIAFRAKTNQAKRMQEPHMDVNGGVSETWRNSDDTSVCLEISDARNATATSSSLASNDDATKPGAGDEGGGVRPNIWDNEASVQTKNVLIANYSFHVETTNSESQINWPRPQASEDSTPPPSYSVDARGGGSATQYDRAPWAPVVVAGDGVLYGGGADVAPAETRKPGGCSTHSTTPGLMESETVGISCVGDNGQGYQGILGPNQGGRRVTDRIWLDGLEGGVATRDDERSIARRNDGWSIATRNNESLVVTRNDELRIATRKCDRFIAIRNDESSIAAEVVPDGHSSQPEATKRLAPDKRPTLASRTGTEDVIAASEVGSERRLGRNTKEREIEMESLFCQVPIETPKMAEKVQASRCQSSFSKCVTSAASHDVRRGEYRNVSSSSSPRSPGTGRDTELPRQVHLGEERPRPVPGRKGPWKGGGSGTSRVRKASLLFRKSRSRPVMHLAAFVKIAMRRKSARPRCHPAIPHEEKALRSKGVRPCLGGIQSSFSKPKKTGFSLARSFAHPNVHLGISEVLRDNVEQKIERCITSRNKPILETILEESLHQTRWPCGNAVTGGERSAGPSRIGPKPTLREMAGKTGTKSLNLVDRTNQVCFQTEDSTTSLKNDCQIPRESGVGESRSGLFPSQREGNDVEYSRTKQDKRSSSRDAKMIKGYSLTAYGMEIAHTTTAASTVQWVDFAKDHVKTRDAAVRGGNSVPVTEMTELSFPRQDFAAANRAIRQEDRVIETESCSVVRKDKSPKRDGQIICQTDLEVRPAWSVSGAGHDASLDARHVSDFEDGYMTEIQHGERRETQVVDMTQTQDMDYAGHELRAWVDTTVSSDRSEDQLLEGCQAGQVDPTATVANVLTLSNDISGSPVCSTERTKNDGRFGRDGRFEDRENVKSGELEELTCARLGTNPGQEKKQIARHTTCEGEKVVIRGEENMIKIDKRQPGAPENAGICHHENAASSSQTWPPRYQSSASEDESDRDLEGLLLSEIKRASDVRVKHKIKYFFVNKQGKKRKQGPSYAKLHILTVGGKQSATPWADESKKKHGCNVSSVINEMNNFGAEQGNLSREKHDTTPEDSQAVSLAECLSDTSPGKKSDVKKDMMPESRDKFQNLRNAPERGGVGGDMVGTDETSSQNATVLPLQSYDRVNSDAHDRTSSSIYNPPGLSLEARGVDSTPNGVKNENRLLTMANSSVRHLFSPPGSDQLIRREKNPSGGEFSSGYSEASGASASPDLDPLIQEPRHQHPSPETERPSHSSVSRADVRGAEARPPTPRLSAQVLSARTNVPRASDSKMSSRRIWRSGHTHSKTSGEQFCKDDVDIVRQSGESVLRSLDKDSVCDKGLQPGSKRESLATSHSVGSSSSGDFDLSWANSTLENAHYSWMDDSWNNGNDNHYSLPLARQPPYLGSEEVGCHWRTDTKGVVPYDVSSRVNSSGHDASTSLLELNGENKFFARTFRGNDLVAFILDNADRNDETPPTKERLQDDSGCVQHRTTPSLSTFLADHNPDGEDMEAYKTDITNESSSSERGFASSDTNSSYRNKLRYIWRYQVASDWKNIEKSGELLSQRLMSKRCDCNCRLPTEMPLRWHDRIVEQTFACGRREESIGNSKQRAEPSCTFNQREEQPYSCRQRTETTCSSNQRMEKTCPSNLYSDTICSSNQRKGSCPSNQQTEKNCPLIKTTRSTNQRAKKPLTSTLRNRIISRRCSKSRSVVVLPHRKSYPTFLMWSQIPSLRHGVSARRRCYSELDVLQTLGWRLAKDGRRHVKSLEDQRSVAGRTGKDEACLGNTHDVISTSPTPSSSTASVSSFSSPVPGNQRPPDGDRRNRLKAEVDLDWYKPQTRPSTSASEHNVNLNSYRLNTDARGLLRDSARSARMSFDPVRTNPHSKRPTGSNRVLASRPSQRDRPLVTLQDEGRHVLEILNPGEISRREPKRASVSDLVKLFDIKSTT